MMIRRVVFGMVVVALCASCSSESSDAHKQSLDSGPRPDAATDARGDGADDATGRDLDGMDGSDPGDAVDTPEMDAARDTGASVPPRYACPSPPEPDGPEYFASPGGSPGADGSRGAPWSFSKALDKAAAGDTITLLAGNYPGHFRVSTSGTKTKPITIRSEARHQAVLVGKQVNAPTLTIDDQSYIRVDGLRIEPDDNDSVWFDITDADHITLANMWIVGANKFTPSHITDSDQIAIVDSVIREGNHFDNIRMVGNNHVRVVGSAFSRGGHDIMGVYDTDKANSNQRFAVRGNVFHGVTSRNVQFLSARRILFEHNVVTNGFDGPKSATSKGKFLTDDSIFRFNRAFMNRGGTFSIATFKDIYYARRTRIYNNVFADNHGGAEHNEALYINSYGHTDHMNALRIENNIFSGNGRDSGAGQIWFDRPGQIDLKVKHNVFWAADGATPMINGRTDRTIPDIESEFSHKFSNNKVTRPKFVDARAYNHALAADSPLRDAGRYLTRTTRAGQGRTLPVADVRYFFDGFGIDGERGDLIAVGAGQTRARIVQVDLSDSTLQLDRAIEWDKKDPVGLPWSGDKTDIGAYEHGGDGRAGVRIAASKFNGRVGAPIDFEAIVDGDARPAQIIWQMGDGAVVCGSAPSHTYESAADYPVRVKVVTADGRVLRGTHYVLASTDSIDVRSQEYNKQELSKLLCGGGAVVKSFDDGDWNGWTCK